MRVLAFVVVMQTLVNREAGVSLAVHAWGVIVPQYSCQGATGQELDCERCAGIALEYCIARFLASSFTITIVMVKVKHVDSPLRSLLF